MLFVSVFAFALAMRSFAESARDDGLIVLSAIGISIITATGLRCLGSNQKLSMVCGVLGSTLVLALHYGECLAQSTATEYVWHKTYFSRDPILYLAYGTFVLLGCFATASGSAFLAKYLATSHQ